jgi:hypothetical protein
VADLRSLQERSFGACWWYVHSVMRESPNDPKLSDTRRWRGPCVGGGEGGGPEAGAVTAARVRCSARLGDVRIG